MYFINVIKHITILIDNNAYVVNKPRSDALTLSVM